MRHLLKVVFLLLLDFLDLWRNVKVALLKPLEYSEHKHSDDGLQSKADVRAQLPSKFGANKRVDGGQVSKVGKAGIESDEHASECMRRE